MAPLGSGLLLRIATMLEYPTESLPQLVSDCRRELGEPDMPCAALMDEFSAGIAAISPARLEETYTATFELAPSCSPYVGDLLLKDPPKRAGLLIKLKEDYRTIGLDPDMEMPDHIALLLRYMAALDGREPSEELRDLLIVPGLEKMAEKLGEENPYGKLVKAALKMIGRFGPTEREIPRDGEALAEESSDRETLSPAGGSSDSETLSPAGGSESRQIGSRR